MLIVRAYKAELDLNNRQITGCRQHAGAARWAYNWGLRVKQERYRETKKSPTAIELHRELNTLKKTDVPWLYEVSKCAPQEALWNLDAAFQKFFLKQLAGSSSDSHNACGATSAGTKRKPRVKLAARKQEPDTLDVSA